MISARPPEPTLRFKAEDLLGKLPPELRAEFLKLEPHEQQFLLSMNPEEAEAYAALAPQAQPAFAKLPKTVRRAEARVAKQAERLERATVRPAARKQAVPVLEPVADLGAGSDAVVGRLARLLGIRAFDVAALRQQAANLLTSGLDEDQTVQALLYRLSQEPAALEPLREAVAAQAPAAAHWGGFAERALDAAAGALDFGELVQALAQFVPARQSREPRVAPPSKMALLFRGGGLRV